VCPSHSFNAAIEYGTIASKMVEDAPETDSNWLIAPEPPPVMDKTIRQLDV
jgi:hypothetical protein